jgi:hypothetical protein
MAQSKKERAEEVNSKLKKFLEDNAIEMHIYEEENKFKEILCYIPHELIKDFMKSCVNDECSYDFDDDEAYIARLRNDYLCLELSIIIEYLEEDINDYYKLCTN